MQLAVENDLKNVTEYGRKMEHRQDPLFGLDLWILFIVLYILIAIFVSYIVIYILILMYL